MKKTVNSVSLLLLLAILSMTLWGACSAVGEKVVSQVAGNVIDNLDKVSKGPELHIEQPRSVTYPTSHIKQTQR